jgi:hypothetical protein
MRADGRHNGDDHNGDEMPATSWSIRRAGCREWPLATNAALAAR